MAFSTTTVVLLVTLLFGYSIFKLNPLNSESLNNDPELRWNWDEIDLSAAKTASRIKSRSPRFTFGTATAAHQVEGNCTNNWSEWEDIPGNIANGDKSGDACQHYILYKEDIQLMKNLGVRSYRFSIEWSKIQPEMKKGIFSQEVTQHYHDVIDELIKNGIAPMITLHHYTNPVWFQNIGEFSSYENLIWFEDFAEYAFKQYGSKVKMWCTFNEVMAYVMPGFWVGTYPPGKRNLQLGMQTLANILACHTNVYHKLKKLPHGNINQIGIVKEYHQMDPLPRSNLLLFSIASYMHEYFNELMLNYFEKGEFKAYIPFFIDIHYKNELGKTSNDFIGLNYYSHFNIMWNGKQFPPIEIGERPEFKHLMTDMGYPVYAEGLYRALKRFDKLKIPIVVTENGLADAKDSLRETFIKRYTYALSKAVEEGVNVQSYYFWSLMDNFEWIKGYAMKFGLYHVDYKTQKRTLRRGSMFYIELLKEFYKN